MNNISTSPICLTLNDVTLTCATLEAIDQAINQRLAWIEDVEEDYGELVEAFFGADIDDSKAWRILIGIGYPHSVVHFSTLDGTPPFYCSRHPEPPPADWPELAEYFFASADSETSRDQMVPAALAREALREFARTGSRPTCVHFVDECDYSEP